MFLHEMCSTRKEYDELRKPWALVEREAYEHTKRNTKSSPTWIPKVNKERDVVKLIVEEARIAWMSKEKKAAERKRAKAKAKAARDQ